MQICPADGLLSAYLKLAGGRLRSLAYPQHDMSFVDRHYIALEEVDPYKRYAQVAVALRAPRYCTAGARSAYLGKQHSCCLQDPRQLPCSVCQGLRAVPSGFVGRRSKPRLQQLALLPAGTT